MFCFCLKLDWKYLYQAIFVKDTKKHAIQFFWGYVDDCGVLFRSSKAWVNDFINDLNTVHTQFKWEVQVSSVCLSILDLSITKAPDYHITGAFNVSLYRKPSFKPMYIAPTSEHTSPCKYAIAAGEFKRFQTVCSTEYAYNVEVVLPTVQGYRG